MMSRDNDGRFQRKKSENALFELQNRCSTAELNWLAGAFCLRQPRGFGKLGKSCHGSFGNLQDMLWSCP